MSLYRGLLQCPKCGKDGGLVTYPETKPPHVNCGDCLMNNVEIVELEIVSTWELTAPHPMASYMRGRP
jgi:hypothetical protein